MWFKGDSVGANKFRCFVIVINQMDTSQAHLSGKASNGKDVTKPDNLSREELTAVLKYGAQKLCVPSPPFLPQRY